MCTKSVHGGTNFCVAHGGGKRCAVSECIRSARGRTNFCVRHGGGRRCHSVGCGKSAQGSTDFCKAHGGGKRCLWGHSSGSGHGEKGSTPCISFARGKTGLCTHHSVLVNDKRVHGSIMVGPILSDKSEDIISFEYPRGINQFVLPSADPEGRVHGGSLMSMFVGGISSSEGVVLNSPDPEKVVRSAPEYSV